MPPWFPPRHSLSPAYISGFGSLVIFLLLSSGSAYAKWTMLGISDEIKEASTNYVDLGRIQRTGHMAKMWTLYDYTTAQTIGKNSYMSIKEQREYDCQEGTFRTLVVYLYLEHLGEGKIVGSYTQPREWQPAVPESMGEDEWKVACEKK